VEEKIRNAGKFVDNLIHNESVEKSADPPDLLVTIAGLCAPLKD